MVRIQEEDSAQKMAKEILDDMKSKLPPAEMSVMMELMGWQFTIPEPNMQTCTMAQGAGSSLVVAGLQA